MTQDGLSLRRILSISRKETQHIRRDPFTLIMAFVLPVVLVLIFGFAIDFNLTSIPTVFVDFDQKPSSRDLIRTFGSSGYFKPLSASTPAEGLSILEAEKARAVVLIPAHFERDLKSGREAPVQVLLDAADNSSVGAVLGYLGEVRNRAVSRIFEASPPPMMNFRTRFLFNGELKSPWFIVPGLVVLVVAILSILLTSLTIAREWESGSMELLLSTPVKPVEIILGKLFPYAVMGGFSIFMVYVLARTVFGLPFEGSHVAFALGSALFLVTALAQGMIISIAAKKQVLAMQLAMLSGLLPSMLLSGFIFPIESMHPFFQYLTAVLPARWFMVISRDSFLQSFGLAGLLSSFAALSLISALVLTAGALHLRKDLE